MSKAAATLILLTWLYETYAGAWSQAKCRENRALCRLIAGNLIAGNV